MVKENDFDLAEALSYVTSNPADALQLSRKGRLREGMDADIVLLDNDLAIDTVIARGQLMMKDKQLPGAGNLRIALRKTEVRGKNRWKSMTHGQSQAGMDCAEPAVLRTIKARKRRN